MRWLLLLAIAAVVACTFIIASEQAQVRIEQRTDVDSQIETGKKDKQ